MPNTFIIYLACLIISNGRWWFTALCCFKTPWTSSKFCVACVRVYVFSHCVFVGDVLDVVVAHNLTENLEGSSFDQVWYLDTYFQDFLSVSLRRILCWCMIKRWGLFSIHLLQKMLFHKRRHQSSTVYKSLIPGSVPGSTHWLLLFGIHHSHYLWTLSFHSMGIQHQGLRQTSQWKVPPPKCSSTHPN